MFAQLKFDLKKNLFSSTNAVVYVAFMLLLLTTFSWRLIKPIARLAKSTALIRPRCSP
ncbi:hypothetical protein [Lacticaseibacillus camelliae]|uniref:hypothetical protein n=1 Tax=Lacticaseibacillus camelliae TaxID=381742 RepID=UPI000ADB6908|nr:hypothetical protein [Lacticaseibacillus camelliae]